MSINSVVCCTIAMLAATVAGGARAGDMDRNGVAGGGGTLALAPETAAWAEPLKETEMADLRGGFNGLAFSISLSGLVDGGGSAVALGGSGTFGDTSFQFAPDFGPSGGQVTLQTFVGDSLNGFSGIFQAANVIGDGVVIDQTLTMNLNVFLNSSSAPSSLTLFGG